MRNRTIASIGFAILWIIATVFPQFVLLVCAGTSIYLLVHVAFPKREENWIMYSLGQMAGFSLLLYLALSVLS